MKTSRIVVIGSSNTDLVIQTDHLPVPGETILGGNFFMNPGGKGANQAVAAARLGGAVTFICKTGKDIFGKQSQALFQGEGIDTRYVFYDPTQASGVALITVDKHAENCIAVALGANSCLMPADVEKAKDAIDEAEILLMQLEIPMEPVEFAARMASEAGKKVVLNPAPAANLSDELLKSLYLITPNETEAERICGKEVTDIPSAIEAAQLIRQKGVKNVIITLGSKGALVCTDSLCEVVPSYPVKAVDTTAAGDNFNGALCIALAEGQDWISAVQFANKAAAISVTRAGAQASAPTREEVKSYKF